MHPAPHATSTLSLHDALPISGEAHRQRCLRNRPPRPTDTTAASPAATAQCRKPVRDRRPSAAPLRRNCGAPTRRSEEHTSELQSRENLVCRLLLEKKKNITYT